MNSERTKVDVKQLLSLRKEYDRRTPALGAMLTLGFLAPILILVRFPELLKSFGFLQFPLEILI